MVKRIANGSPQQRRQEAETPHTSHLPTDLQCRLTGWCEDATALLVASRFKVTIIRAMP
jgi:hypothetical protein